MEGGRKGRRKGRREGGLAEGRVSLDFPSDGQDGTSLGGEGGGRWIAREGSTQGWRGGWGGEALDPLSGKGGTTPSSHADAQVNLVRLRSNTVLARGAMGQESKE
jgi:hypothetical protein